MPTVAINGLGRIGRAALKILLDSQGLEVAAVNDIAAADNLAYLLKYDTVTDAGPRREPPRRRATDHLVRQLHHQLHHPVIEIAHRRIGVERAVMTTVHAYTATQQLVDGPSKGFRRGRAAAANLVPATTGAARATTRSVPELSGRFDGLAVRAPIPVGSIADIVFVASGRPPSTRSTTRSGRRRRPTATRSCSASPTTRWCRPTSSATPAAVVDLELTTVVDGTLVKVMAWYDNEWGFIHQMIREARSILGAMSTRG